MRIACWITKATNTHTHTHTPTQCLMLFDFPLQPWSHERPLMLPYTYIPFKLHSKDCVSAGCFLSLCVWNVKFIGDFALHTSGSVFCSLTERKNELRKERLFNYLTFPPHDMARAVFFLSSDCFRRIKH
jgi:hypothetical protein